MSDHTSYYPFQYPLHHPHALFLNEAKDLVYEPPKAVRDCCQQLQEQECVILSISREICKRCSPGNGQYREVYGEEGWLIRYELPKNLWHRMKVAECWVFDTPVEIPENISHVDVEIC